MLVRELSDVLQLLEVGGVAGPVVVLEVGKADLGAESFDQLATTAQVGPRHRREEVVLDLKLCVRLEDQNSGRLSKNSNPKYRIRRPKKFIFSARTSDSA